jgi:MOB kinase activator 1
MLYGIVADDLCTPKTCPVMNAGKQYEYLWADPRSKAVVAGKPPKPRRLCAAEYMELMMEWVEVQMSDPRFPGLPASADPLASSDSGTPPAAMPSGLCKVYARLFRAYAHLLHSHCAELEELGAAGHLNMCFKVRERVRRWASVCVCALYWQLLFLTLRCPSLGSLGPPCVSTSTPGP